MDEQLILGIDIGTSAAKAVLATGSGRILARASYPQHVARPEPGRAEQDPDSWWVAVRVLVAETWRVVAGHPTPPLAGVAISGHFPTLVACDAAGVPVMPALLYEDTRADGWLAEAARLTGQPLRGDELLPKLLWMRAEQPDLLRSIRHICNPQDYLVLRLTGEHVIDHFRAARSGGLLDPAAMTWRNDVVDRVGVDQRALPPLRRAGDIAGLVTRPAAAATGIPEGTPVLVGVADTPAALIGAGVVRRGDVLLYYGTTTTADVCTHDMETYLLDPATVVQGAPYREVAYAALGPALAWAAAGFDRPSEPGADLAGLDREVSTLQTELTAPYVLPDFLAHSGPDARPRLSALIGFDIRHGRIDLHRALLEAFGFAVRAGLEESETWELATRFVASGGGAHSAPWRQIVSDILGVEQVWPLSSGGALGDAMLVAWANGLTDFRGGLARWLQVGDRTWPNKGAHGVYDARYRTWLLLRDHVAAALGDS